MLNNKKAVELPITAIIIFVILIVVAVVILVIFTGKTRTGAEQLASCALKQGECSDRLGSGNVCPDGYASLGAADCNAPGQGTDYRCCLKVG